jgi:hypothetical protein
MTQARVYVASSWRNEQQPSVVAALRDYGLEVYDFKHPRPGDDGFHWSEIDGGWKEWDFERYHKALNHELAEAGYESDMDALRYCDACILVLPCGRSAHLELGIAAGWQKHTAIYHPPGVMLEPELMTKKVDFQTNDLTDLCRWVLNSVVSKVTSSYPTIL